MAPPELNVGARGAKAEVEIAQAEAPRFEHVEWTKEPHLRKLYALACVLMVASATTGYDGMLVNTSQQIDAWPAFFGDDVKDNNKLGILINMFNIGSIISFFITPYVADHYGRKVAIVIGCSFMILGGCLTAFCNGYGSEYLPRQQTSCHQAVRLHGEQCTLVAASSSVLATLWLRWPRPCS